MQSLAPLGDLVIPVAVLLYVDRAIDGPQPPRMVQLLSHILLRD